MSIINLPGKKEVIGVDLGTSAVKILEMKVSGNRISVLNYIQEDISALGIEEKSPEERSQTYINVLKKMINAQKFSTKNCAFSVSGSSVIVRLVKFPKMSKDDLEKSLQFEAEPHIPFDIQEVAMDTQIIGEVEEGEQTRMETVLVAGKKETIQEKLAIIEKAGLSPSVIDVDAFAVENAYEMVYKDAAEHMVMLVNIGATTTNICIIENGAAKVVRDLYTAGNSFTRAIQNSMQIATANAEELKKKFGLGGDTGNDEQKTGEQIYNVIYPVVRELISEIQRSVDFFTSQKGGDAANVEKIILTGGSANLKGLPEIINSELRIPVELFKPLENADVSSCRGNIDKDSPSLSVVTGLALRKPGDTV